MLTNLYQGGRKGSTGLSEGHNWTKLKENSLGAFVFFAWDIKMGFAYGNDLYGNVTCADFTCVKHCTMFVKITIFMSRGPFGCLQNKIFIDLNIARIK